MNRQVLRSMITLVWVFLIGFAVVKLFFAEWLLASIDNEQVIQVGKFIDQHRWATVLADSFIGTLAIHFYLCSCKSMWRLRFIEYVCVFVYSVTLAILQPVVPSLVFSFDGLCFILVPILMGISWKRVLLVFLAHDVGQVLILFIRSQPLYLEGADYVTSLILVFDVYVWLLLYYLYANMYKEVRTNGNSRNSLFRRQDKGGAPE